MFDKTIVMGRERTQYVTKDVHIHNAPTADQAKLLDELRKEAWEQVTDAMVQNNANNILEVVTFQTSKRFDTQKNVFKGVFRLNGQKIEVQGDTPEERDLDVARAIAQKIVDNLSYTLFRKQLS